MGSIRDIRNVWRDNLVIASFRGAPFHVENSTRASGRRTVVHEYPKRNSPYSEDMGRHAIRWTFTAYLILRDKGLPGNLLSQMAMLISALEADDAGMLIHPILGTMLCMCDRYSYSDNRQRGGYVEFDMSFVEAGSPVMSMSFSDAGSTLDNATSAAENNAASAIKEGTQAMQIPLPQPRPSSALA